MLGITSGMFLLSLSTFAKIGGGGFKEINSLQRDKQTNCIYCKKKSSQIDQHSILSNCHVAISAGKL